MFKNYLKVAIRNLLHHWPFSLMNILGLAIGMCASLYVFLYVSFELSYDKYHKKADRIYRVVVDLKTPAGIQKLACATMPVAPNLKMDFPEVKEMARIQPVNLLVQKGDKRLGEVNALYADSSLFSIFDFSIVKGDPKRMLVTPFSVVLSESTALKYFRAEDPIGQTLIINNDSVPYVVTGIIKDMPENSHFKAGLFVSMSTLTQKINPSAESNWGLLGCYAYILLPSGYDAEGLQSKLPEFMDRHVGSRKHSKTSLSIFIEPLKDIYLRSTRSGFEEKGNLSNIYVFIAIGVFVLGIACINFVNLITSRSVERAKEVGIRKVIGSSRLQLIAQFMSESFLLCFCAFLIACLFSYLFFPVFNNIAGKIIAHGVFDYFSNLALMGLIAIIIALLAGIYPAFVLSAYKPVSVLKNYIFSRQNKTILRRILVVIQFTISIGLIIATITVYNQLKFVRNLPLGFSKDQMLVLNFHNDSLVTQHYEAFKRQLAAVPHVLSVSTSSFVPGFDSKNVSSSMVENKMGDLQESVLESYAVDYDFIRQFDIKMAAGRAFSRDFATDSSQALVLNEAAIAEFGYSSAQDAIGKRFSQKGRQGQIIGVIKDFHFRSLLVPIKPLSFRLDPASLSLVSLHLQTNDLASTLGALKEIWDKNVQKWPFNYFFLDDAFNQHYRAEERFGQLALCFSILTIFISCLGLLGLAAYSALQRTKEIGVRKVMGATVWGIVSLLTKDFLKLVVISFIIASPIAWLAMNKWLDNFTNRIQFNFGIFLIAGLIALAAAWLTVSFQAVKAAVISPARSLRTD